MSTRTPSSPLLPRHLGALLLAVALSSPSLARAADDDPMAPYRERFRTGMDRYKAGDLASAVTDWEAIYREVGPDKGYRVAFDLARAYDKLADAPHARDRYRAFLHAVDQRRAAGLAIETIVAQEESEAHEWLAKAGDTTDSTPPATGPAPQPPQPAAPLPASPAPAAPVPAASPAPATTAPIDAGPAKAVPPFSPVLLVAAGAATVTAIVLCGVEYGRALSAANGFNAASGVSAQTGYQSTYDGARPLAYASLGASVGLAAITAGLTVWYFTGTKWVVPVVVAEPGGAQAGLVGRF